MHLLHNQGLGHALNQGLARARSPLVAYLPSDDVIYRDHLQQLCAALDDDPGAVLAHASVRHHYSRQAGGAVSGHGLQLVQCLHRRTDLRWCQRNDYNVQCR